MPAVDFDLTLYRWIPLLAEYVEQFRTTLRSPDIGPLIGSKAREVWVVNVNDKPTPGPPETPPGEVVSAIVVDVLGIGSPGI
jgi:hypothetical protein